MMRPDVAPSVTHVLIVEDEPGIRESLVDFFESREFLVSATGKVTGARMILAGDARPSIVLLDLMLEDGDGLDLLTDLRRSGDRTPVVILTARGEETQRIRGLEAGADDYVVKPFSVHELLARLHAVLRRTGSRPVTVRLGDVEVDLDAFCIRRDGQETRLLQKEAELLGFLIRHPGRTFRREDLLREVWGYDATPTTRTVDTHVFQLRQKIEARPDRPRHLLTIRGAGYRLAESGLEPPAEGQ